LLACSNAHARCPSIHLADDDVGGQARLRGGGGEGGRQTQKRAGGQHRTPNAKPTALQPLPPNALHPRSAMRASSPMRRAQNSTATCKGEGHAVRSRTQGRRTAKPAPRTRGSELSPQVNGRQTACWGGGTADAAAASRGRPTGFELQSALIHAHGGLEEEQGVGGRVRAGADRR
jgi:hypothetical protein